MRLTYFAVLHNWEYFEGNNFLLHSAMTKQKPLFDSSRKGDFSGVSNSVIRRLSKTGLSAISHPIPNLCLGKNFMRPSEVNISPKRLERVARCIRMYYKQYRRIYASAKAPDPQTAGIVRFTKNFSLFPGYLQPLVS
jgi:hypothetical protein